MIKRIFDVLFSFLLLIILFPLIIVLSLLVKLNSPGPAIFQQVRVGKDGRLFKIYKIRTMGHQKGISGLPITTKDDPRVSKLGKFLRKYKLDELPQLFNVMKGDMSFVGPRPEVQKYFKYYTDKEKKEILSIKPGITDISTIKFRNESDLLLDSNSPEKTYIQKILPIKKKYYRFYVKKRNFIFDLYLIFLTLKKLFLSK